MRPIPTSRARRAPRSRAAARAAVAVLFLFTAAQGHAQDAFESLAGSWSGNGTVTLANGANERIRCRATYALDGGGATLHHNLRCASDSYKFDLSSSVNRHAGGAISGAWREATRNASGRVTGRAAPGEIQANVDGPGFSANLGIATRGDRQSITIRSQGAEVKGVSINLAKASP